jgi:F0F1-type ATP synthase membrane subunit b/b'
VKRLLLLAILSAASLAAADAETASEPSPVWKWANFAILAAGLGYLMTKHLPPLFTSRTKEIQKGISESQQMKQDAEKRSAEMDARLNSLGADIEKFRTQSAAEMQQEGERIGRETAAQIKKVEEHAAVEIEAVGKTARRHGIEAGGRLRARPGASGVSKDGVE